jgi:hypothetical protein
LKGGLSEIIQIQYNHKREAYKYSMHRHSHSYTNTVTNTSTETYVLQGGEHYIASKAAAMITTMLETFCIIATVK